MAALEAHTDGLPMMRAMVLEFPDDPACTYLDRQYLLGEDLLVAPVFSDEGDVSYYVPDGRWTNLLSGDVVVGPGWQKETHGYMSVPVLVRPKHDHCARRSRRSAGLRLPRGHHPHGVRAAGRLSTHDDRPRPRWHAAVDLPGRARRPRGPGDPDACHRAVAVPHRGLRRHRVDRRRQRTARPCGSCCPTDCARGGSVAVPASGEPPM